MTTPRRASLKSVSTTELTELREALTMGRLRTPLDRSALVSFGVREQLDALEGAFAGHKTAACVALLDVVLAERADRRPPPELVWTGPEAPSARARDTAVVLRELFESARQSVVLGGYSFVRGQGILAPLHRSMRAHGVTASFFVDVPQVERGVDAADHLRTELGSFFEKVWTFGNPRPRIYYDKRALFVGPPYSSLHAKCVVVDGKRAFVSSANFTERAQEQNLEVGVLLDDESFAQNLAGQWLGLVAAGLACEYTP
jgi:phosphatidylserine/phosphatidylglycerophosphate/cardiolipin synthase-like enzyme